MSDIGRLAHVAPSQAQLSVDAYFDQARFEREQSLIFAHSPQYIGSTKSVPESGDYQTLAQENGGRVLVNHGNDIALLSNVCRHRQALMLNDRGNTRNIVCPLHRWTYALDGHLIGAPHFQQSPCLNLRKFPLENWQGLLFEPAKQGSRSAHGDLQALSSAPEFDLSGYHLDRVVMHECQYNWKTFIEVYLEDYHVGPFHPGLGNFVTCDDLNWQFGESFSLQRVGIHANLAHPGTPTYGAWHQALRNYCGDTPPPFGAIWLTYYPTLMIELYPYTLVVSTLYPLGPQKTLNKVEFYYPEEIIHFERDFIAAEQAAYFETTKEDDEIAERMDAGRRILMQRGTNEVGPYQSPMEDGMLHFHEWYRRVMHDAEANVEKSLST